MKRFRCLFLSGLLLGGSIVQADQKAELIFTGGPVITVDEKNPTAEAVAIAGGRIIAVGDRQNVFGHSNSDTRTIDLKGHTLLPGFIDSHGHLTAVGFQQSVANLNSNPDGDIITMAEMQQALQSWAGSSSAKRIAGGQLIIGMGYDDALLQERRHPTRQELDAVSTEVPVIAVHKSGHLATLNSRALAWAGVDENTPDPKGGVIRREADGRTPNGILEESAWSPHFFRLWELAMRGNQLYFTELGQQAYVRQGFTTAQEGGGTPATLGQLVSAAGNEKLQIDVVAYPFRQFATAGIYDDPWYGQGYRNRSRVGGVKLSLDGSPQGRTAWLTLPYKVPPQGERKDYRGYPVLSDETVSQYIREALKHEWQIIAHCNGDAAADQFLGILNESASVEEIRANRAVVVHAQTLREDQLDTMKTLGVIPTYFSLHTYYWGDWHRDETLGRERAYRISPAASTVKRGMVFTSHHDAPAVNVSSIPILSALVTRKSRSGDVIGPEQRVSMEESIKALTIYGAYQYGEEDSKGSIETGKLADFVVLSANPLTTPPDEIIQIEVLQTIKEGRVVYDSNGLSSSTPVP